MTNHPLHKLFWLIIVLVSLSLAVVAGYFGFFAEARTPEFKITLVTPEEEILETETESQELKLMFVGDMMFDRGVESSTQRNFGGDFAQLFDHLDIFDKADLLFGNLEGPASDKGRNVGSKYSFRMDPAIIPVLADKGFNMVSFANNHVGDYSQSAFEDTLQRLERANILYTGAGWNKSSAEEPAIFEANNMRIGFLGFTDVGPNWMEATETKAGILLARDSNFSKIIQEAEQKTDFLITSFHWGDEYVPFNNRQQSLAHRAIDAGADMVIGHHPHVVQDTEIYQDKLIAYSLGNFIFDQYFSNETMEGMLLEVTLATSASNADESKGLADSEDSVALVASEVNKYIIELDRTYQPIEVRPLQDEDIVKSRVSFPSLCPSISKWHPDKSLFPVNRENSLGLYEPQKLTHMPNRIETRGTATCLDPETANATEQMFKDMNAAGLKPVMTSGYRPHNIQKILYNNWVARQNGTLPAYPAVAEPGHSEHQLGTTIDIKSLQTDELSYDAFGTSPEYQWMQKNAHTYGFVQSYPTGKEEITGYIPEPWHWRYVGSDIATQVRISGLTLSEFLSQ
jgi:poly-gamma-glutamate synthesis protein (capsule biosynthesis protein)